MANGRGRGLAAGPDQRVSPSSALEQTAVDDFRAGAVVPTRPADHRRQAHGHTARARMRTDAASAPSSPGRGHVQLTAAEGTPEQNAARKKLVLVQINLRDGCTQRFAVAPKRALRASGVTAVAPREFIRERSRAGTHCSQRWPRGYRFPIFISYSARIGCFSHTALHSRHIFLFLSPFLFLWPQGVGKGDRQI